MPRAIMATLLFVFLPLTIFGIVQSIRTGVVQKENNLIKIKAQSAINERQRLNLLQQQFQELSDHYNVMQSVGGRSPVWAGIFNALSESIPRDIYLTYFSAGCDAQQPDTIMLEGKVLNSSPGFDVSLATLLSALGASPFFRQVNVVKANVNRSGNVLGSFEIRCELVY
jgi:Tfp pilus assembly protein PilN